MQPCFTPYPASSCSRFKSLVLGMLVEVALRFELPLNLAGFVLQGVSALGIQMPSLRPGTALPRRASCLCAPPRAPLQATAPAALRELTWQSSKRFQQP